MKEVKNKSQVQQEALKEILKHNKAGVEISMGVGKTLLGLMHMVETCKEIYNPKFLVVAPKVSIFDSWKSDAKKHGYDHLLDSITFTTYISLRKESYDYDVIYLDECHSLKNNHDFYLDMAVKQGIHILGLTGTYPKFKSGEKGEMCNKYCPKVYEYKTDDAVEDKILNDYRIYVHMVDLSEVNDLEVTAGGKTWRTSERKNYEYWTSRINSTDQPKSLQIMRVMRMKAMMGFPSKERKVLELLTRRKTKTILFANTQEQADRLAPHSYHSNNSKSKENLEMFKKGEIELLSAVEQLSEGVNIPELRSGIIMHAYSNNRKASQKIGRLLRLNPDDTAGVHILCYRNTVDEEWVKSAVSHLNPEKITWLS
jgi:superfamily II DNA or RNA helicase